MAFEHLAERVPRCATGQLNPERVTEKLHLSLVEVYPVRARITDEHLADVRPEAEEGLSDGVRGSAITAQVLDNVIHVPQAGNRIVEIQPRDLLGGPDDILREKRRVLSNRLVL
jgi:hypothetical protein